MFLQVNKLNSHDSSVEPQNMTCGNNMEAVSAALNASLECPGDNMSAPGERMLGLLNKDDTSNDLASAKQLNSKVSTPGELTLAESSVASFAKPRLTSPMPPDFGFRPRTSDQQASQSHSAFPSLSMVYSGATSLSSHNVNERVENQDSASPTHMTTAQSLDRPQHGGFPKPYQLSSILFRSPDSASSSIGTSSAAPYEQHSQNSIQQEYNSKQYSGNSSGLEHRSKKETFIHEGLTDINSSTSLDNNIQKQELLGEHGLEAGVVGSNDGEIFPPKYDSVNYQHPSELSLSGQNSGNKDIETSDLNAVSSHGVFSSGNTKGWKVSQEGQGNQSTKTFLTSYPQMFHQQSMFSQNDIPACSVGTDRASNAAYPSQISLPMVQSWFKQYQTLNNEQRLRIFDPSSINATQPSSEITPGNIQDNSFNMQANVANTSQGSGLCLSTAVTPLLHNQSNPPSVVPSDSTHQNLGVTMLKKRKLVAFEMVPWYKEVNSDQWTGQDISTSKLSWALAANRKEEVISEAEIVEDMHPVIQAKRRLICSTQLMQQIFRPAPSVIIFMDASSNCDYIAFYAARLALGDACSLTNQLPSDTSDVSDSSDKPKTSRRTDACKFSKTVDGIICRMEKLEDNLTRLEKSLSVVDIKVEAQELEKFSTINRFAKFHARGQQSTVDTVSSSGTSALHKVHPQRYVMGHPMPKILPEGVDCLSL